MLLLFPSLRKISSMFSVETGLKSITGGKWPLNEANEINQRISK